MIRIINSQSLYSSLYATKDFCKKNWNEEIEIVVPDKLSLFMERFLFEKLDIKSSFNIKINTLNRFAKKNCIVPKDNQISKIGSILLIYKILNEKAEELQILKNKRYSFSYAEEIFNTISQLKASKISFDEMFRFDSKNEQLAKKIIDLAIIYKNYEDYKAGLLDASDVFLLSAMTVSERRKNKKILFVGFFDFTAIEYTIIERLAVDCDVNIINYYSKTNNRYIYNGQVFDKLKSIAYINELVFEVEKMDDQDEKNEIDLKQYLTDNLFGIKNNKFVLNKELVNIFSGKDFNDEIEFIARQIRQKILSGKSFANMGVAVFDLNGKEDKIKEIFSKYEINYYIDTKFQLDQSIFYKFILSILKFNLEGYSLIHLIDLINSPFFILDFDIKQKLIAKLKLVKFRGINLVNLQFDEDLTEAKNQLQNFINLIVIDKNASIIEFNEKLMELDKILNFDDILLDIANKKINLSEKIILNKSKEVVFGLFDDIAKYYSDVDLSTIYDIYSHISNIIGINNLPQTLDAVKIIDASDCLEIFDDLYLANCRYDNAPKLKFDCGIILDNEIEELNFKNKLSPTIAHINRLKKLELFNTALMFEKNLIVTYSHSMSELIKELLARLQVKVGENLFDLQPIFHLNFGKYIALSKWDYLEFLSKNNKKDKFFIDFYSNNKDFLQISNDSKYIYDNVKTISSSQLENYFKCPFYYFINNVLKIKPDIENEIQSLDVGNILHELLFNYYKRNKQVDDIYEFCKSQIFKIIDRDERLKINASSPILTNLIDESVRVINGLKYIDENTLFKPVYFEYEFNNEKALHLDEVDLVGKIDRVDCYQDMVRVIDYKSGRAEASLKELFYGNKLQLFLYSIAIENAVKKHSIGGFYLPLHNAYTREIVNNYSLKGFFENDEQVVHALDKRLQPGDKSDIVNIKMNKDNIATKTAGYKELSVDEMNSLKEYAIKLSNNAIKEIKSGYIEPTPSDISNPCEYCPYVHICMRSTNGIKNRRAKKIMPSSFKKDEV